MGSDQRQCSPCQANLVSLPWKEGAWLGSLQPGRLWPSFLGQRRVMRHTPHAAPPSAAPPRLPHAVMAAVLARSLPLRPHRVRREHRRRVRGGV